MRIEGIGLSLIDVERFRALRLRFGERFLRRFFSASERAYAFAHLLPDPHLAGRLAAKIALCKALGEKKPFLKLEVSRGEQGKPEIQLLDGGCEASGPNKFFLSISHSGTLAIAQVLIEGE